MPDPTQIELYIKRNGGAPETGVVSAAYDDAVVLSLGSFSTLAKKVKYRIRAYPPGFPCPAGWTTEGVFYTLTKQNGSDAPSFALPAAISAQWGKFIFDAEINDGLVSGVRSASTFAKARLKIPSASGVEDIAYLEEDEFDPVFKWHRGVQDLVRRYDEGLPGSGDVAGDTASTSGHLAIFFGTGGKAIRDGGMLIADLGINVKAFGAKGDNSTVDQTALVSAVAGALALGKELYWPDGTYVSNATIPNLHLVRHRGPGIIKRGTDLFSVHPLAGNTNRLYVATTGSAGNDGLSSSQPMAKPQDGFDALKNYGPFLEGTWRIVCAAGSYSLKEQQHTTPSRDYVYLEGPAVSMGTLPTAVFDGSGFAPGEHGFRVLGGGVQLWAKNIKVQDYNAGSQNSIGIFLGFNARLVTENVHGDNCDWGAIVADGGDLCYLNGGKFSANRSHVVMNATRGWVGYQNGCTFSGATQSGVYWSRSAQGHIDNNVFDTASPYHIVLDTNSRAHVLGNDFRLASSAAIATDSGGNYYEDPASPNIYNDGTGNANVKRYANSAFTGEQVELQNSQAERRIYVDDTTRTLTSVTKAQIGADLSRIGPSDTLKASRFVDKYSKIRIKVWGECPAAAMSIGIDAYQSAGPTTTAMEYSASTGTPGAGAGFEYECTIFPSSPTVQRSFGNFAVSNLGTRYQNTGNGANFALSQMLRLMGQSASGTITVRRVEVWVTG